MSALYRLISAEQQNSHRGLNIVVINGKQN